jgi:glyoxylate reductase
LVYSPSITGMTAGIVGVGNMGGAVASACKKLGMRVIGTRRGGAPHPQVDRMLGPGELDALLAEGDVIFVCTPLTPETRGLIDGRRLALLRDGSCLVNTARGEIVDEQALVAELLSGRLRAGLDVFAHEPVVPAELFDLPNVVLTPHLGSGTRQTREAMTRIVVDNILAYDRGEPLQTPVTL